MLIVCMGVSGCGKSTLARSLAVALGVAYLEADDFHSAANRAHMASGHALDDAMREPWITSLIAAAKASLDAGNTCLLAWSGLRRAHRQRFRSLGHRCVFLHLTGSPELVRRRLDARPGHFMPASLLDSQLAALEPALDEPDVVPLDLALDSESLLREALDRIAQAGQH
jgi:gluconokinase